MKKTLLEKIEEHLTHRPEDANEILKAVSKGLDKFNEKVRNQKSQKADIALRNVFCLLSPSGNKKINKTNFSKYSTREKCIYLIDAIQLHFPQGFHPGYSKIEKDFLQQFCDWYFNEPNLYGSDWEKDAKNVSGYMEMLKFQWEEENATSTTTVKQKGAA